MVVEPWQADHGVTVPFFALLSLKLTRIWLPAAHAGALNKATRGLAVFTATGLMPVTNGFTWKLTVLVAVSPETKSLATTLI
jgi:hypothetical protein